MGDFSYAFSTNRDVGGSYANNGNPKAATFVGTAISKWDTASATTLYYTYTFWGANEMNADLTGWKVGKVVTLAGTFYNAVKFIGTGLTSWDTASTTTMDSTFHGASEMNADLTGWKVGKVVTLLNTFFGAAKFTGTGLSSWDIASATSLWSTFYGASKMNADLTGWKVGKVITLEHTFNGASKFTGTGVDTWNVVKVTSMFSTFLNAASLASCNKHKIADAWTSSAVFVATTYDTDWAADTCAVRFE